MTKREIDEQIAKLDETIEAYQLMGKNTDNLFDQRNLLLIRKKGFLYKGESQAGYVQTQPIPKNVNL